MNNYCRITGYYPKENVCFIADSNGRFEKLWQFSSYLVNKGVKILAVGDTNKFTDGNIGFAEADGDNINIRACDKGQPKINGETIEINGKFYSIKSEFHNNDKSPESLRILGFCNIQLKF